MFGNSKTSGTGQKVFSRTGPHFCHSDLYWNYYRFDRCIGNGTLCVQLSGGSSRLIDLSNVEVNLNNTSYIYVTDPETQEETVVKDCIPVRTVNGSAMMKFRR